MEGMRARERERERKIEREGEKDKRGNEGGKRSIELRVPSLFSDRQNAQAE